MLALYLLIALESLWLQNIPEERGSRTKHPPGAVQQGRPPAATV